jgi:hypothetical protein
MGLRASDAPTPWLVILAIVLPSKDQMDAICKGGGCHPIRPIRLTAALTSTMRDANSVGRAAQIVSRRAAAFVCLGAFDDDYRPDP